MWMHGFLGFDASFMLDVVMVALVLLVPVQLWSIRLARTGRFALHKTVQLSLAAILLVAVGAFEVDLQLLHGGWQNVVNKDPDSPRLAGEDLQFVRQVLWVHLVFAVSTPVLWAATIVLALRRMPVPPAPCPHSPLHRKLGWASVIDLVLTAVTGMLFYYLAFIA
jgi:putative membrane protein